MNNLSINSDGPLIEARLKVLLEYLNNYFQNNEMALGHELIALYHDALQTFFQSLDSSITATTTKTLPGSPADPNIYNELIDNMGKDLRSVYSEIGALDYMISANFNSMLLEYEGLLQSIKRIGNKTGDYLLYAAPSLGAGYFFGDSFNTGDKLDLSSSLITTEACFHSPEEGVLLLPLDGDPLRPEVESVIINSSSNGTAGNNHQLGFIGHNNINTILDGEPNTWFEYEIVAAKDIVSPLVLDLTIVLKESSVINHININPINFGTPTPLTIISIDTSRDGIDYLSIKDEIPIKDFVPLDEENIFELSSNTSKGSGQGFYSFSARKVKYIHIVFNQYTPYTINTVNGLYLRYAIGLRDINILGRKFKTEGTAVSTLFNSDKELKKVSLFAAESPLQKSDLVDCLHYISNNNGGSWYPIQPTARDTTGIPEIVNFNNIDSNSISCDPVYSLRHKVLLTRNNKAFTGETTIKEEILNKLDVISVPAGNNLSLALTEEPIVSSVNVIAPFMGSFSCPRDKNGIGVADQSTIMNLDMIEFVVQSSATQTLRYKLPYKNIPNLINKIRVFVNGAQIEYFPTDAWLITSGQAYQPIATTPADETSRIYFLDNTGTELQFGHKFGNTQIGFIPQSGSKIQVCLDGDNPSLSLTDNGYILHLTAPSDGAKDSINIIALETIEQDSIGQYQIEIPTGVREYQIPLMRDNLLNDEAYLPLFIGGADNFQIKEYYLDGTKVPDGLKYYQSAEDFVNGRFVPFASWNSTLNLATAYSFDETTGTIFLGTAVPADRKVVFICKKLDAHKIPNTEWEFSKDLNGKLSTQDLLLKPTSVYTISMSTDYAAGVDSNSIKLFDIEDADSVVASQFRVNVPQFSWHNKILVKNTVRLDSSLFNPGATPVEVAYINGQSEFDRIINVELEPITFSYVHNNLWSFTLSQASSDKTFVPGTLVFKPARALDSATRPTNVFNINGEKDSSVSTLEPGEWYVTNTGGTITVTLGTDSETESPEPHYVSYQLVDNTTGLDREDLYSIDYTTGTVFFGSTIASHGTVYYEVSVYSAFYNIGTVISDIDSIDAPKKTIKFDPEFGLANLKQTEINTARPQVFKVLYNYAKKTTESLADLEPYFSPICKDVAFRCVTADLLDEL